MSFHFLPDVKNQGNPVAQICDQCVAFTFTGFRNENPSLFTLTINTADMALKVNDINIIFLYINNALQKLLENLCHQIVDSYFSQYVTFLAL